MSAESKETCAGRCIGDDDGATCAAPFCGDGKIQSDEFCDDGDADNTDACTQLCASPTCGDGFVNNDEVCDDANTDNTDGCTQLCASPTCGDGFVNNDEECDDANTDNTDGCTQLCAPPTCGDGFTNNYEICDDANSDNTDDCTQLCAPPTCGDGFTNNHEECDAPTEEGRIRCTPLCDWAINLDGGGRYTCSTRGDGRAKCWGENASGQLGLGDATNRGDQSDEMGDALQAINLGAEVTVRSITAGQHHTCAILDNGSVKCWGYGYYGQLGLGDMTNRGDQSDEMGDALPVVNLGTDHTAQAVTAGQIHTCAILDDGSVRCWGHGLYGQLGLSESTNRGDQNGEMGDALQPVNLGSDRTAWSLTAGQYHTCAVLDNGWVKCWGQGQYGQLGLGDMTNRGDQNGEMGDALPAVDLGTGRTARSIAAGQYHTCAILDDGSVKCWGNNQNGQLGLGDTSRRGDQSNEMGDALPTVDLGAERTATTISAGEAYTCVTLDNASIKCWGYNQQGQLGAGDLSNRGDQSGEMGDALPAVNLGAEQYAVAVTAGQYHTCAVLQDASIKCWGYNQFGQLGLGHITQYGDSSNEMGDALPPVSPW